MRPSTAGSGMHEIKTFGGVEVGNRAGEIQSFRSRKHVALLVYLRSSPRRVHLRERLAGLFWATESSLARHSLSQALYDLRSTLGQVIVNCPGDAVRIQADLLDFDVEELERAIKRGELPRAVELYTGPFAPDLDRAGTEEFEHWLERERSRLSVLGQTALRQFLEYADSRGEWGEMCSAALRLIRMNPLDEVAHRALMRGLWLHGDQASALDHFGEVRERLEEDLADGISEETLELVKRIEGSRPRSFRSGPVDQRPPLVGRERELEELARFAEQDGDTSETLVIQGEAGIGKTRLAEELEKLLTLEGCSLLGSQCYAAEAEVAYGPILDGLREIVDQLSDLPGSARYRELGRLFPSAREGSEETVEIPTDGQSARRRLFEEVADVLRRYGRERRVVWVVEDVHCIDGASSALLHYLARRLATESFRLVLTTRPESEQNESARSLLNDEFFAENSRVVAVRPLHRKAVGQLVGAIRQEEPADDSLVDRIATLSGGNPFYAVELAKISLRSEATLKGDELFRGRLKTILKARLHGLSFESVRVLEAVAILGIHARPLYIVEMCGFGWGQLLECFDDLQSRGILKESGNVVSYTHEITREFINKSIGLVSRSAFHLKAGELLAGNPDIPPSTIAAHFKHGGDSFRAFEYALKAVRQARSRDAFSEAREMSELALDVAQNSDQMMQALRANVEASRISGHLEKAQAGLKKVLSSLDPETEAVEWWNHAFSLMEVLIDQSSWNAAYEHLRQLKSHLNFLDDKSRGQTAALRLAGLELSLAVKSKRDDNIEYIVERLGESLKETPRNISGHLLADVTYPLAGYYAFYDSAQQATKYLSDILDTEQDLSLEKQIKCRLFRGAIYTKLGSWDEAQHDLNSALELTTSVHDVVNESAAWNNMGCLHLALGEWSRARDCFEKAVLLQDISDDASLSTKLHSDMNLANTYFYRGQPRKANQKYRECLSFIEDRQLTGFRPEVVACIGLTGLQCGDYNIAVTCADHLASVREGDLKGIQERYKIDWLLYYMGHRGGMSIETPYLDRLADEAANTDLVSSLKLRCLRRIIDSDDLGTKNAAKVLRQRGLQWFIGFSRRWYQSAETTVSEKADKAVRPRPGSILDYAGAP